MKNGDLVEYVNGEIGIVVGICPKRKFVDVLFKDGEYEVASCGLTVLAKNNTMSDITSFFSTKE